MCRRRSFGRPEAAAVAKLFIASAGPTDALDACMPLFEAMGQTIFRIGSKAPTANLVKLSGNFLIASVIESLGEHWSVKRESTAINISIF
jgi:3-hydroxyisobutyrate dehydrogenase-like beta-hydroxyacid dehydrogenase